MASALRGPLAQPETVKFPSEAAILKYMDGHPTTLTAIRVHTYVPNTFEAVAKYFANREMTRDQIELHVKAAVDVAIEATGDEDQIKLQKLRNAVQGLANKWEEEDDGKVNQLTLGFKMDVVPSATPELLSATIAICVSVMKDVLDGATFTPPEQGQQSWTRHVQVVKA